MIQYALNIYCILDSIQGAQMLSWFTIKDLLKPKFSFFDHMAKIPVLHLG